MSDILPYTDDAATNALLADDPFALLVGIVLYQQVPVETAFAGPSRVRDRIGGLDPQLIAEMDPDALEAAFKEKPAVHRFPGNMAKRVQAVAAYVAAEYDGDTAGYLDRRRRRRHAGAPPQATARFRRVQGQDLPRRPRSTIRSAARRMGGPYAGLAEYLGDRIAVRSFRPQGAEEGVEGCAEIVGSRRLAVV